MQLWMALLGFSLLMGCSRSNLKTSMRQDQEPLEENVDQDEPKDKANSVQSEALAISNIKDQTIDEDSIIAPVSFTLSGTEKSCTDIDVLSSNLTLVPTANIIINGKAPNCKVTITPVADGNGVGIITLSAAEGTTRVSEVFSITVTAVNDAPVVSTIGDLSIAENTDSGAISFTISDADNNLACSSVSAQSSNTSLVPTVGVVVGGTAPNCTVIVTPQTSTFGSSSISLTISDGSLDDGETFIVTVYQTTFDGSISSGTKDNVAWYTDHLSLRQWTTTERQLSAVDSYFDMSNLIGLWHFDETTADSIGGNDFADSSGNNIHANQNNGSLNQTGVLDKGFAMTAADHRVTLNNNALLSVTTSFSIGTWFKASSCGTNGGKLIDNKIDASTSSLSVVCWSDGFEVYVRQGLTDNYTWMNYKDLTDSQWHFFMVTRNGNTVKTYLDGKLRYSRSHDPGSTGLRADTIKLGGRNNVIDDQVIGSIDETVFFSRVLSSTEIKKLYARGFGSFGGGESAVFESEVFALENNNSEVDRVIVEMDGPYGKPFPSSGTEEVGLSNKPFTAAMWENALGLWSFSQADDLAGTGYRNKVDVNAPLVSTASIMPMHVITGKIGYGLTFSSATDAMKIEDSENLSLQDKLTISLFVKPSSFGTTDRAHIITRRIDGSNQAFAITQKRADATDEAIEFEVMVNNGTPQFYFVGGYLSNDTWHHLALVYDGAELKTYIDGKFRQSLAVTGNIAASTLPIEVGRLVGGLAAQIFEGSIDEVGIWADDLSADEIERLYVRGTATMTVKARSCALVDCSDGVYSTLSLEHASLSANDYAFHLTGLQPANPFFQYSLVFETADSSMSPKVSSVKYVTLFGN